MHDAVAIAHYPAIGWVWTCKCGKKSEGMTTAFGVFLDWDNTHRSGFGRVRT